MDEKTHEESIGYYRFGDIVTGDVEEAVLLVIQKVNEKWQRLVIPFTVLDFLIESGLASGRLEGTLCRMEGKPCIEVRLAD